MPSNEPIAPWMQQGTRNNDILRDSMKREGTNQAPAYRNGGAPPSLNELSSIARQQMSMPQAQMTPNQPDPYLEQMVQSNTIMSNALQFLANATDKKFLSAGTVFLVCIDRSGNVRPDTNPSSIPTTLSNNPTSDIKVVSFTEFQSQQQLRTIIASYKQAIDSFQASIQQTPNTSQYNIFIGRLVESIVFNSVDFEV